MAVPSPPRDYGFPYEPYDIQIQLMDKIYESIDSGKVAILESPTGTGKSLSIICAMLKWISDYKQKSIQTLSDDIEKLTLNCSEDNSGDWVAQQVKHLSMKKEIALYNQDLDSINKHITYAKHLKKKCKHRKNCDSSVAISTKRSVDELGDILDQEDDLIVKYCEGDILEHIDDQQTEDHYKPKICYCSRTHSQLSQFVNEIKKVKSYIECDASLMTVPLSSRANYCINPSVNRSNNVNLINDKCNQLQSGKQKCPMYKHTHMHQLSEDILASVQDLEDIVSNAKQLKACPYYASRLSLPEAEIVILPYNILLHKGTRESFGLKLKDSIVIVDEAHNLLETLASVYSVEISRGHLEMLYTQVVRYMTKYNTRFNTLNLMYIKQLVFVFKRLISILSKPSEGVLTYDPLDFVLQLEIEHINIYKLVAFIDRSHIASKLHMFSLRPQSNNSTEKKAKISGTKSFLSKFKNTSTLPAQREPLTTKEPQNQSTNELEQDENSREHFNPNMLYLIKDLLLSLKDFCVDGKILLNIDKTNPTDSTIKYLLLNSSNNFKDVLLESRSVILCGGTMKPFDDYINQLFKPLNICSERIMTFSCGHVIEPDNLIALGCGNGPNNMELNYTFSNRNSQRMVAETGQVVVQLCQIIPSGVVIFFASYDYAEFMLKEWQKLGILRLVEKSKRIFKEPKKSSLTASVLNSYSKFINSNPQHGAVLFSVMGGKMSEGINFSDALGRGVIVIGVPYANKNSVELKEKMAYLGRTSPNLANEYYENLCMRAVNQTIGRAIRHKNDYAAIILVDSRYCTKQVTKSKLSDWIKSRYGTPNRFGDVVSRVKDFFQNKANVQVPNNLIK